MKQRFKTHVSIKLGAVSPNQSGVAITPMDGVTLILIQQVIFQVHILNNNRAAKTLHHFSAITTNTETV
jgi:hypothetical protein